MKRLLRITVVMCALSALSGCMLLSKVPMRVDDKEAYLEPEQTPELMIPDDMDHREILDSWVVPEIADRPLARVFPKEAPRPAAIVGDADPDLIRIQNLGADRSWMVVQRSPETVWPVVRQWMQDNSINLRYEDPSNGLLISDAIDLEGDDPLGLSEIVVAGKANANIEGGADWVAFRLENGVRRGSAEVHVRYINQSEMTEDTAWPEKSTDVDIERQVLSALANYDAAGYVAPTVSSVGRNILLTPKAEVLTDDDGYPMLRLNLDYARAWATIQKALENAGVTILNSDSGEAYFDVKITRDMLRNKREGLFANFLGRGSARSRDISEVQVSIVESGEAFDVVLSRDGKTDVSIEFVQQFLLMLREYAV